ncbi:hypothetical protein E2C01_023024 [Portunus trituberculatus]|uniref:Uncharacterized protein n=1 Tax=Portunus trituberculatus TaxID=210409 RepID=A0A5B7EAG0_PORTR|nr:hypothetical protein [Portunus trituberculatus]
MGGSMGHVGEPLRPHVEYNKVRGSDGLALLHLAPPGSRDADAGTAQGPSSSEYGPTTHHFLILRDGDYCFLTFYVRFPSSIRATERGFLSHRSTLETRPASECP